MEEELHKRVISQDKAISALARAIRRSRAGLKNPARPIGSFLFLGPTGVGKTEMARTLAQFLFGSEKIADPVRYVGVHGEAFRVEADRFASGICGLRGGWTADRAGQAVNPYSVVLLDEIEKAHPDVFNLLLQVFEDGQLTDGLGNTVDFKNTIIVMTSNIGAKHLMKREGLGFQSSEEDMVLEKMEELVRGEVKRTFNPEFLNRLDEIIIFTSLSDADLMQILELLVQQLNTNLVHKAITISVNDDAKRWILEKTADGPDLWCAASAQRAAAVCRGSAVGGADRRRDSAAAGVPRGLHGEQPAVLPADLVGWRGEGGGLALSVV